MKRYLKIIGFILIPVVFVLIRSLYVNNGMDNFTAWYFSACTTFFIYALIYVSGEL